MTPAMATGAAGPAEDAARTVYVAGLDLGQAADPTALAVAEARFPAFLPPALTAQHARYDVRKLRRWPLRTPYPDVVAEVAALVAAPPLLRRVVLVVDATGVGRPVVDALRAARLRAPIWPVLITGGDTTLFDAPSGFWRVPKRDLVGVLAVLLQSRRLRVAPALEHAQTLLAEMGTFKVRIDPATAHDSYSAWREGQHDDLVLATALLCWAGQIWAGRPAPKVKKLVWGGR